MMDKALDLLKASVTTLTIPHPFSRGDIFNFPVLMSSMLRLLSLPIRIGAFKAFMLSISSSSKRIGKEAPADAKTSLEANRSVPLMLGLPGLPEL
ncbi:hypothetical protein ES703_116311 [subsurface metagenome]